MIANFLSGCRVLGALVAAVVLLVVFIGIVAALSRASRRKP